MKSLKDLVVGDIVRIAPMSGIGEAQDALVEDVRNHYGFDLGTEFPIIIVNGDWRFNAETGTAITPPMTFCLELVE